MSPLLEVPGIAIEIPPEPFTRTATIERRALSRRTLRRAAEMASGPLNSVLWRDALSCLSEAASADPGFFEPQMHLGFAYTAMGEWKLAEAYLQTALTLDGTTGGVSAALWQVTETLAGLAEMRSDPPQAVRAYQRFLEAFPSSAEGPQVMLRLGLLDLCSSRWGESLRTACAAAVAQQSDVAVSALQTALVHYPRGAFLHRLLGLVYQTAHQHVEALRAFDAAMALDPHAALLQDIGHSHAALRNLKAEEEAYRQALQFNPVDATASYHLGRLLHARRAREEAVACLRRAVYLDPEARWADAAWDLLDDLTQARRVTFPAFLSPPIAWHSWTDWVHGIRVPYPQGAVQSDTPAGQLLRVGPPGDVAFSMDLVRHRLLDDDTFGPWRRALARIERTAGWRVEEQKARTIPGATAHLFRLQHTRTDDVHMRLLLLRGRDLFELVVAVAGGVWVQNSGELMSIGHKVDLLAPMALLEGVQQRLRREPGNLDVMAELGCAYVGLDDPDKAELTFQRVLALKPDHVLARTGLARLYWKQKKPDAVIKTLESEPQLEEALILLGRAFDARRQHDQAVRSLRRALDVTHDPMVVLLLLAASYEASRQPALAEEHYQKALDRAADPCYVRLLMAAYHRRQKATAEALACAREATQLDPAEIQAHLLAAFCHMDLKQWDDAHLALSAAATLDPDHAGLKSARQELETRHRRR